MRRILFALAGLASCSHPTQSVAPAPEVALPQPQPPQAPEVPSIPPAVGERLLLEQGSCVYPCPTYRVEVYANGRVRWEGMHFVAAVGEHVFAVQPELARTLFEQWHAIDLDHVPKTLDDASSHPHLTPRRVVHVSASGVQTERYEAAFFWGARVNCGPEMNSDIGAMAAALMTIDEVVDQQALLQRPKCWGFHMTRSGTATLGDRRAAETAAKWYFKHPDFFVVRIVAFDRPAAIEEAIELRDDLIALGVPEAAVWLRRLPGTKMSETMRSGWVAAATPRCFASTDP